MELVILICCMTFINSMKRDKIIIIIFCCVAIVVYMVISQISFKKKNRIQYQEFMQANIDGKLNYIGQSNGVVYIEIEGDKKRYSFIPIEVQGRRYFAYFAHVGDRVIKTPQSNTLTLLKGQNVYRYLIDEIR